MRPFLLGIMLMASAVLADTGFKGVDEGFGDIRRLPVFHEWCKSNCGHILDQEVLIIHNPHQRACLFAEKLIANYGRHHLGKSHVEIMNFLTTAPCENQDNHKDDMDQAGDGIMTTVEFSGANVYSTENSVSSTDAEMNDMTGDYAESTSVQVEEHVTTVEVNMHDQTRAEAGESESSTSSQVEERLTTVGVDNQDHTLPEAGESESSTSGQLEEHATAVEVDKQDLTPAEAGESESSTFSDIISGDRDKQATGHPSNIDAEIDASLSMFLYIGLPFCGIFIVVVTFFIYAHIKKCKQVE